MARRLCECTSPLSALMWAGRMAHIVGLSHRLRAAAGGGEVGAGVQRLAAVAAAAKQAAAAACVLHLVLLPSVNLRIQSQLRIEK